MIGIYGTRASRIPVRGNDRRAASYIHNDWCTVHEQLQVSCNHIQSSSLGCLISYRYISPPDNVPACTTEEVVILPCTLIESPLAGSVLVVYVRTSTSFHSNVQSLLSEAHSGHNKMMKYKEWLILVVREFMDTVIWYFETSYISYQYYMYIHVSVSHSKCCNGWVHCIPGYRLNALLESNLHV